MVKEWGMSDVVGRVAVSEPQAPQFMGLSMLRRQTEWGSVIKDRVSDEVERLVNNSYLLAKKILTENRALLERLKDVLMEQEVVSAEEFQMMLVEFKAETVGYEVLSEERNRDKLPFQSVPDLI
jgi:cell division protease FtsH